MATLRLGVVLFALAFGVYLLNGRFDESPDTFGNELLPISILHHHTRTFDHYYVDGLSPWVQYPRNSRIG